MTKKELRLKYKALRSRLTPADIAEMSLGIANQTLNLPLWHHNFFHVFLPIAKHNEVDTEYILRILAGKDKNIIVSKSDFAFGQMHHFLLTDSTKIVVNPYGIPEPADGIEIPSYKIEVVFVPLLAFDRSGHRVGYGKGSYDRFLAGCSPEIVKVGLSFFDAEEFISDVDDNDVALDYCVTPNGIHRF